MEGMDILQVSANVFDRRMFRAEVFSRAAAMGKTVFIRSIYLQGLITQEPSAVAPGISGAKEAVRTYRDFCARHGVEPRRFAFDYVRRMAPQAKLVVGAETVEQIRQNMEICYAAPYDAELHSAWTHLWPRDHAGLIDPRQWNTAQRQDIRQ
jgi:aryl-alcohol dehydrogenase-like predicted oxidoreductase